MNGFSGGQMNEMSRRSGRKSVLVIDDEPQILGAIADTLANEFEVLVATSPLIGIRLLEKNPGYSVVISDQRMPEMTGDEFLARAREVSPATRLMITGYADLEAVIRAVNLGQIFGYISKPWNPEHLKLAVLKAAEHHELVQNLEAERALLHNLMDNIPDAIFFKDLDHRFVRVNKAMAARHNVARPEDMIGKTPRDYMSLDNALRVEAEDAEIARTGTAVTDRLVQNSNAAGSPAWSSTTKAPVKSDTGQVVSLIGIARDITERKRMEDERARLVAIVEATPDMVATATPDLRVLYCNNAGRRMMGIGADTDASEIRIQESHPEWARKLVLEQGIPTALKSGVWSGETALRGSDGHEIPVLQVIIAHKGSDGRIEYLSTILRNITQRKEEEAKVARLNRIYGVLSGINTTIVRVRGRGELFEKACRIAVEHGKFELAWIGMVDDATRALTIAAKAGDDDGYLVQIPLTIDAKAPAHLTLVAHALATGEPVICNDISTEKRLEMARWSREALKRNYRSLAVLPLILERKPIGIFVLYASELNFFDEQELKLLVEMAGDISFALDHLAKEEKLDYLAYYNAITGLPNRTLFADRLEQRIKTAHSESQTFSVMVVDVERFRHINETLGRQAGDNLLQRIALRLKNTLDETEILAHIGGDRFAIATRQVNAETDIAHVLDRIVTSALGQPFELEGKALRISVKTGISTYPTDGKTAENIYGNAEVALKNAKKAGHKFLFYAPQMNARVAEKLALENKLRRAIERNEFLLYYQPKIALATGRTSGLEALIRWKDAENGLVSPVEFIPVLEDTGMILDVGNWVLKQAVSDYQAWRALGLEPPRIAVNVSPLQLRQNSFVADVKKAIAEGGGSAGSLELEITESLIMEEIEQNIHRLKVVQEMGTTIAVDDFGTGYSSLSYIARLPINSLKIDRAFITNMATSPDSMAIVSTIISLAHSLSLKVVAEGVETDEQVKLLRLLRCDEVQGYHFSKPLPAEQLIKWLGK